MSRAPIKAACSNPLGVSRVRRRHTHSWRTVLVEEIRLVQNSLCPPPPRSHNTLYDEDNISTNKQLCIWQKPDIFFFVRPFTIRVFLHTYKRCVKNWLYVEFSVFFFALGDGVAFIHCLLHPGLVTWESEPKYRDVSC